MVKPGSLIAIIAAYEPTRRFARTTYDLYCQKHVRRIIATVTDADFSIKEIELKSVKIATKSSDSADPESDRTPSPTY
jgi:DnaJ-class molecular chaperone